MKDCCKEHYNICGLCTPNGGETYYVECEKCGAEYDFKKTRVGEAYSLDESNTLYEKWEEDNPDKFIVDCLYQSKPRMGVSVRNWKNYYSVSYIQIGE